MAPQVEIFVLCGKIKTKKPLLGKGLNDDSDWARTSDLYPVKVALSQLSYGIGLCISSGLSVTDSLYYITIMISRQWFCSKKAQSRYPYRLFTDFYDWFTRAGFS